MKEIVNAVGPCTLKINRDRYGSLVRSIVCQQISTSAARSICSRLTELAKPDGIVPENVARLSTIQLRSCGLSSQKLSYINDLTKKVIGDEVDLSQIGRLSDERVIETLTQIKGVGHWTAQMFLVFSLGRPDVLPHGDLGIRTAIRDSYNLGELPGKATCIEIATPWRPYASVASWYLWRSLDVVGDNGRANNE